jgi:uncharacterized protein (DUF1697 family)
MQQYVALLRGINVGPHKRIPMQRLREVLADAGFEDIATYVQSGNVVLRGSGSDTEVARQIERAIHDEWGFDVATVTRSRRELAAVIKHSPFADVADDPARYTVTFFPAKPPRALVADLDDLLGDDLVELHGRDLYTWSPHGISNSTLMPVLGRRSAKLDGTARNWRTVERLLAMCDSPD